MSIEWKDISSYRQGDTERVPTAWECYAGRLRIRLHRHIHHAPDEWLLSCDPWFDLQPMQSKEAPVAKAQALDMVGVKLREALDALGRP